MRPKRARERRGWTCYRAAKTIGVGPESVTYMESNPARLGEMRLRNAIGVIAAYWPDVNLQDLIPGTPFRIVREDQ